MTAEYDVIVVGAGPAGLSAAVTAAEGGIRVAMIDAAGQPGGQFWRHPDENNLGSFSRDESTGHHHWGTFRDLRSRFRRAVEDGSMTYLPGRQVWRAEHSGADRIVAHTSVVTGREMVPAADRAVTGKRLIIATGAYDRQLPIPGWTLPGAMAAGGVQALLKAHQVSAGRRAVVAGTGPFLMSVAAGLAESGVEVVAVCDINSLTRWAATPWRAMQEPGKLLEGAGYARTFVTKRIPFRMRTAVTEIRGSSRVEQVVLQKVDAKGIPVAGSGRVVDVDLVALGWGFTPQLELAVGLGLETRVDVDGSLVAVVGDDQRTSDPVVFAAGETTGIGGAVQSCAEGELAARAVMGDLSRGRRSRGSGDALGAASVGVRREDPGSAGASARLRRRIARGRRFAVGMHLASPVPSGWSHWLRPSTIVCRCEEVTAGEIADTVRDLGADDPRDVRVTARPGMGWCQGRVCGFPLSKLVEAETGCEGDLVPLSKRPIGAPVRLGDIADHA